MKAEIVFPCTGCGLCCRKVGVWVANAIELVARGNITDGPVREVAEFPFPVNVDGSCSKLDENNRCSIYNDRPDICSIEKTWEKHHKNDMTLSEYYKLSAGSCNTLIDQEGLDKKYLVKYGEHKPELGG